MQRQFFRHAVAATKRRLRGQIFTGQGGMIAAESDFNTGFGQNTRHLKRQVLRTAHPVDESGSGNHTAAGGDDFFQRKMTFVTAF